MASIKQRKSKFSVIYWYMDDTGERKQKWDTLETKKEAKARKAFIEFYQQTYGYVLVPLEEQFAHQREEAEQAIDTPDDEITLKESYEDDTYTFSIEGIYDYEGGLTVFLPQEQLNRLFDLGSDYFSGYLSDSEITDIDQKYIGSVIDLDSLSKISRQLNVSMGSMMYLLDGFSIVLFMILIYLLSKIIIEKNAQSISMTKILGYSVREISSLYLLSTTIMVVIFLLLSFPIETVLMKALFRGIMISSISGWIPLYIDPILYVKMFLLGFGTYLLVALIEYRRIKKVPMDQALKNIE